MTRFPTALALFLLPLVATAQDVTEKPGLLVMAHGGSEEWNSAVMDAVEPLRKTHPVAIAFGMANPETLQTAADSLVASGVSQVHVVRLFISGESFFDETEYAFGLRNEAPSGHFMHPPKPINLALPVTLSSEGLMDIVSLGGILKDRAEVLSQRPEDESVLIIGHGPGSDEENEQWLHRMDQMADSVRASLPFRYVQVETLREDWTGKREHAEVRIRAFVERETQEGRTVLVIPFRLHGFGPYAEVLEGLEYHSDGTGFLPDARITDWISHQYQQLIEQYQARTGNGPATQSTDGTSTTRPPDGSVNATGTSNLDAN